MVLFCLCPKIKGSDCRVLNWCVCVCDVLGIGNDIFRFFFLNSLFAKWRRSWREKIAPLRSPSEYSRKFKKIILR